jgi:hypothetical protein
MKYIRVWISKTFMPCSVINISRITSDKQQKKNMDIKEIEEEKINPTLDPPRDHIPHLLILYNTTRFREFHVTIIINQLTSRNKICVKIKICILVR